MVAKNAKYLHNTPRGLEHDFVNNNSKRTCSSDPVKRWPKSGTDSAKTPKISSELEQIIKVWPSLPEHIKQAIKALIQTNIKQEKE